MENRLVGTTSPTGTLKYDPLGRLIETSIVPGATTQFLYDGDALVGEYSVSGGSQTLIRRYVHGNRVDEPWVQYNDATLAAAQRRYLHADHQGSIVAHSNSSGRVPAQLKYDAYGVPDAGNPDRFGYTGQTWLSQLGLNYYKARMYSPKLGRFLQTDPIFYADDMNIYAYVGNDPVNNTDPRGSDARETHSTTQKIIPRGPHFGQWTIVTANKDYKVIAHPDPMTNGQKDAAKAHDFSVEKVLPGADGKVTGDGNTISISTEGDVQEGNVALMNEVSGAAERGVAISPNDSHPDVPAATVNADPWTEDSPDESNEGSGPASSPPPGGYDFGEKPVDLPSPSLP